MLTTLLSLNDATNLNSSVRENDHNIQQTASNYTNYQIVSTTTNTNVLRNSLQNFESEVWNKENVPPSDNTIQNNETASGSQVRLITEEQLQQDVSREMESESDDSENERTDKENRGNRIPQNERRQLQFEEALQQEHSTDSSSSTEEQNTSQLLISLTSPLGVVSQSIPHFSPRHKLSGTPMRLCVYSLL